MKRFRVGILGATGTVGQRLVTLLERHPFFVPTALLASTRSAGQKYRDAVADRWSLETPIPAFASDMVVGNAVGPDALVGKVDFVFCALDLRKDALKMLEERYAKSEIPVISNTSAHRFTPDVPMVIPEVNPEHLAIIDAQKKRLGTRRGFIAVKSNCSLQSYIPLLHPLKGFGIKRVAVCTYQAVSGAGKTFQTMPEIADNLLPYIDGEEEKSEWEPLKIWGIVRSSEIVPATAPVISAQCFRVPVSDGHTAAVSVSFENKPSREEILSAWKNFAGEPQKLMLPSAPKQLIHYLGENDRPQPRLDRMTEGGMAIMTGRLREDPLFDWKFVGLSHNTLRGAAGGAILLAELLAAQGYLD